MAGLRGQAESLYIKCLFDEARKELQNREILFHSDSYYVMCLKLRLNLLEQSENNDEEVSELKAELDTYKKKPAGYCCSIVGCDYVTKNYNRLLQHLKQLHSGSQN